MTRRSYSVHQLLFHSKKLLYGSVVRIMQTQTISCSKRGTHLGRWYGFTVLNITFNLTVCHLVVKPETWDFKKLNIKYVLCLLSPNSYSTATHSWRSCVCDTCVELWQKGGGGLGAQKNEWVNSCYSAVHHLHTVGWPLHRLRKVCGHLLDSAYTHTHVTHYTAASLRQCSLTQTHELKCCSLEKRLNLEANLAACHGVAQLSLIVNEGHYA